MVHTHILLLIFPGQGAINPALQFAKNIIRMGVKVTVATTISANRRMPKTSQNLEGLTIVLFSDGYDDGMTNGNQIDQFLAMYKIRATQALEEIIANNAKAGRPVTHVVYTMLQPWAAKVAHTFHIPSTVLWIQPATVFDIYYFYFNGYGDEIKKISNNPRCSIELPVLPQLTSRDLPSFMVSSNSNWYKVALPGFEEQLEALDGEANTRILINTFDALEPEALRAVEKHNLVPIGPLVPSAFLKERDASDKSFGGDLFGKSRDYVEWLDLKPQFSVIYVSFGTMAVLSKRQIEEIARGLLETHRPFLWAIRFAENGILKEEDKLSCIEELEQVGMIVPWCSQVEVLSHPSLGCFFTHCGWNSTLESLVSGIPMVGFPQFTDQPTNGKLIEDVFKTGVRVIVNEEGIAECEEIKRCIEIVMGGGEEGDEMRRNANKWKDLAMEATKEGGSSDINLRAFVDEVEEDLK